MIRDTFHLVTRSFRSRSSRTAFVFACILAFSRLGQAAPAVDPLNLFKNYFITGDAASIGVAARGTGDPNTNLSAPLDLHIPWCGDGDTLRLKCVPKYVDNQGQARQTPTFNGVPTVRTQIIAAFVYWEVMEKTRKPSGAKGVALDPGAGKAPVNPDPSQVVAGNDFLTYPTAFFGKPIGSDGSAPCWSSGGSTGFSNGAPTLRVYRLDYLRYLKFDTDTGERIPWARIQIPDSGSNGNTTPLSEGASLVVAYRNYKLLFRGVVLYDGAFTLNQNTDSLDQTVKGFYQSALLPDLTTDQSQHTKFTHIVGDGQSNFPDITTLGTSSPMPDVFNGPFWDDITFDVSSWIAPGADSFKTKVYHGSGSFDCLSWGAMWISTPVQDSDGDGLLDKWESTEGFTEVVSGKKINLAWKVGNQARGADPCVRNIFIEVDWMSLPAVVGNVAAHTHEFSETALNMVANALSNAGGATPETGSIPASTAPVLPNCPGGIGAGINPFFDVGDRYQTNPHVVPKDYAEGGDVLNENSGATYCTLNTQFPQSCVFPNQVGVISWKKGVHHIQKAHVPGTSKQYFSDYRFHIYHWGLLGHLLGLKGAKLPNVPSFPDQYQANSNAGKADLPGGDFVVTHGGWRFTNAQDAYRGSTNLEAFTFLHELAHNLWGYHGGEVLKRDTNGRITQGMNCKINQQSVLNYGYHSLGLLDRFGNAKADLSGEAIVLASNAEQESALLEGLGVAGSQTDTSETKYRLRWFAARAAVEQLLRIPPGTLTPVRAHCDGTPLRKDPATGLPTEPPMVRVDRLGMPADILKRLNVDWNYDGVISSSALTTPLDLNFDGYTDETYADFKGINDWLHILEFHGLQQLSTRRGLFGLSAGVGRPDLLLAGETADIAEQDIAEQDIAEQDIAEQDIAEQDIAPSDSAEQDIAEQDIAEQDIAQPDPDTLEIDANTAGGSAPSGLTAAVSKQLKAIVLNWQAPTAGAAIKYTIYRLTVGTTAPPFTVNLTGTPPPATYNDTSVKNQTYIYYVTASFDDSRTPSATDTSKETVSFADLTGWSSGTRATVSATGGGLTAGTTYYLNVPSATTATFHPTYADALAGTNKVNLTSSITAMVVVESTSGPSNIVQISY